MPGAGAVEYVRLTGPPAATTGSDESSFLPDKRFQLLAYLAYDAGWVGRERAAFLFWPDSDTANSKQNLRGLLKRLRTLPFDPGLEVTNHQLRWRVPTDVAALKSALAAGNAQAALSAYRGPLLAGMEADGGDEFAEWLEIERQSLYARWRTAALTRLSELQYGDENEALGLFGRLLEQDPLDEESVRSYLETMTRIGSPAAATHAYTEFASRLQRDMGLEPTSRTVSAYQAALSAPAAPARIRIEPARAGAMPVAGRAALPTPTTSFVGREAEHAEITSRLGEPGCRLLSLVGPGGVGKTRLALRVSQSAVPDVAEAVLFVPLDSVATSDDVLPKIAAQLGLGDLAGPRLLDGVASALAGSRSLVVLDNFEHVLGAAALLPRLLAAAPDLKVVVTTRERLGLDAEFLFPVMGLSYPEGLPDIDSLGRFSAARLLLDRAQRVRPGFTVTEQDMPWLERFFGMTQGLPLAIELAAVWLRAMTLRDLVEELGSGLDLLRTAAPDAIGRHGSIRGVFEQSWSRLSESEREVLRRLAVFAGPATAEAAIFVAGANRVTLACLVDKSLLRLDDAGRYARHPLLQQFITEKLAESPSDLEAAERRHAAFYLRFLRERTDAAFGPTLAVALAEIHAEMHEIKLACRRAARRADHEQLLAFMQLLELDIGYFLARGHDDESLSLLARASEAAVASGRGPLAADLRGRVGDAYGIQHGDTRRAIAEYQLAADLAKDAGSPREAVFVSLMGVMRHAEDEAAAWAEMDRAMEIARQAADGMTMALMLEHRAYLLAEAGELESARQHYRDLIAELRSNRVEGAHPYESARRRYYATMNLGAADHKLGNYDAALEARQDALQIAEEMGNAIWQAHAHLELGEMYGSQAQHDAARAQLRIARDMYRENNVTGLLGRVAQVARELGYDLGE